MSLSARRRARSVEAWPGYVDVLSTLLMVIVFVMMVFVIAQLYLSQALTGRDEALARLNRQLSELSDMLSMERGNSDQLRIQLSQMSSALTKSTSERDDLRRQLTVVIGDRDSLQAALADNEKKLAVAAEQEKQLTAAYKSIDADAEKIKALLSDIAALQSLRDRLQANLATSEKSAQGLTLQLSAQQQAAADAQQQVDASRQQIEQLTADIAALQRLRAELEAKILDSGKLVQSADAKNAALQKQLDAEKAAAAEKQKQIDASGSLDAEQQKKLEDAYKTIEADKEKVTALLADIATLESLRDELSSKLTSSDQRAESSEAESAEAQKQVALLNQQLLALREELGRISTALDASELKSKDQQAQITSLGSRLNAALASKVEELARYRSEFFGRLREVLGNRPDIQIVGDRFVLQSEVLFDSGSAEIGIEGQEQLDQLATTLILVTKDIPNDINWVLRIDGHTDKRPISTAQFPSNLELSAARAIAVAKFLAARGLPQDRLVAAGMAEFQPLDPGFSEEAFRRNRRIEFKLDQR